MSQNYKSGVIYVNMWLSIIMFNYWSQLDLIASFPSHASSNLEQFADRYSLSNYCHRWEQLKWTNEIFTNIKGEHQAPTIDRGDSTSENTQIHKCTNAQIHKYANVQMHKYTNTKMYKCTNTQIQKWMYSQTSKRRAPGCIPLIR